MDTNWQFPYYAVYKGTKNLFKKGEVIRLFSFNSMSEHEYSRFNMYNSNSSLYKPNNTILEEGYAEYSSINGSVHGKVHITEIEAWNGN